MKWIFNSCAVFLLNLMSIANADLFDYRNTAMGGSGVASSNFVAAALYNPALLIRYDDAHKGYVLTLPSIGVEYADTAGLVAELDDVSADIDTLTGEFESALALDGWDYFFALQALQSSPLRQSIIDQVKSLDKSYLLFDAAVTTSLAKSDRHSGWAMTISRTVDVGIAAIYDEADEARLNNAATMGDLSELGTSVLGVGMYVTDYSASYGHEFWLAERRLALGATIKLQQVETLFYRAIIDSYNKDDITNSENKTNDRNVNLDLGVSYWLNDAWNVGATVFNMRAVSYETVHAGDGYAKIEVAPLLVGAVSYRRGGATYAFDFDLTDRATLDIYAANKQLSLGGSRFYRLGVEWQPLSWLSTRLGYRSDRHSIRENLFSAGVGVHYFGGMSFDLALMAGASETYGGVLRLAMEL